MIDIKLVKGNRVGHAVFVKYTGEIIEGYKKIECECDCGNTFTTLDIAFWGQKVKCCGCTVNRKLVLGGTYGPYTVLAGPVIYYEKCDTKYYQVVCNVCGNKYWKTRNNIMKRLDNKCKCIKRRKPINIGDRFDRLTVIRYAGTDKNKAKLWTCVCDCGNLRDVVAHTLNRGFVTSCGCKHRELSSKNKTIHGMSRHPIYTPWRSMINKLTNPRNTSYHLYGGKGISCSEEFKTIHGFNDAMGPTFKKGLWLERKDPTKDFSRENCYWISSTDRHLLDPGAVLVEEYGTGKMLTVSEVMKKYSLTKNTVNGRLKRGFTGLDLLKPPKVKRYTPDEIRNIRKLLEEFDVHAVAKLINRDTTFIRKLRDRRVYKDVD